ncbi:hypothetical protein A7C99_1025 [Trichophyton rubrum]|uniref:Uncharacterized protein n=1 Tax=Trichophyton rubrum TaxID=5551 RepID=A0A178F8J2_TRIRU|nr:hypothetical protein A7C99_1025 [Trichophyton rubrum]
MACSGNAWHGEGSVSDSAPDPSPLSSPSSGARMSPVTLHKGASQAPSPVCLQPVIVDQAPGTRHQVFLSPPCQSQQTLKDKSSRNPVTLLDTTEGALTYSFLHNYYTVRAQKTSGRKVSKVKLFELALKEVIRNQVLDFRPCSAGVGLFLHERT